jgi:hypothetical protein
MAEHCATAVGENSRHPESSLAQAPVPVGVDAPVKQMQFACVEARINGAASQPQRHELPPRNDPMLPRSERPERSFSLRVRLTMHISVKLTRNETLPRHGR